MKHTVPDPILTELSHFVAQKLGLHFPKEKWLDLERAIKEIARAHHFDDLSSCIHWIMHSLSGSLQIDILAKHLTIGETYFFREKSCFEALKKHILPDLLCKRITKNKKVLRIWSAPCSSGEEPYSIAMLLTTIIPNINEWNITILASDINEAGLNKMKEGIYTDWSFRETPPAMKDQFFTKIKNNRYEISPKIKKMVTPLYLNLSQDCFPDIVNGTNAMDLIFCRNMLMYFVEEHRTQVINQFYHTLMYGGHLVVGASEAALISNQLFIPINYPGAIFYQKNMIKNDVALKPIKETFLPILPTPGLLPITKPFKEPVKTVKKQRVAQPFTPVDLTVEQQFHMLANQGKLTEALDLIDNAIKITRFNPLFYFFKALLLLELDQIENAKVECKKAIYNNPDFVLPYFILGNIYYQNGEGSIASSYYKTVLKLLVDYSEKDILPGSEGLNSVRVKQIIHSIQGFDGLL